MATSLNQDDYLKTALRLPRDLHAKIHEAAQQAERSMNAEIVARLAASFEPKGPESWSEEFVSAALLKAFERINALEKNLLDMIERGDPEAVRRILDTHRAAHEKRIADADGGKKKKP